MALISKIRNNSWLLVVVIGLALASFILMDMTSGGPGGRSTDTTMATINGEPIDYRSFQEAENILFRGSSSDASTNRANLWNYFMEKTIADQYAASEGLGVSSEELIDLQFGNNLSPIVQQRFINQNTGQVDRQLLNQWKNKLQTNDLQPEEREFWKMQLDEVKTDRIQTKINSLVSKAIYTPTWMADIRNKEQKGTRVIEFVKIPYNKISDASVTVTDDDYKRFIDEHKSWYKQDEPTRVAQYTHFNIVPTAKDSADIRSRLSDLKRQWIEASNDSIFVVNKRGVQATEYVKKEDLPLSFQDSAFQLEIGTYYGPFLDGNQYRVVKILDRKIIPDSVQARHILRGDIRTQEQLIAAESLIDSIKTAIESGSTTFAEAAERFGTDATRTEGGDLGMSAAGRMVKPFNDLIFYQAEPGKLYKAYTQFGVHLVEVTDQVFETNGEGVRLASLHEYIKPSVETQQVEYDKVFDLISEHNGLENLSSAVSAMGGNMMTSSLIKENDYLFQDFGPSNTSRQIVRWLFTPGIKVGETSPEVYIYKDPQLYYNSKLVLVGLKEINDGQLPSIESLRQITEARVLNEKKAQQIISDLGGKNMQSAADQYNVPVDQTDNLSLALSRDPKVGAEPEIIGAAFAAPIGSTIGPIAGNEGVYYIHVMNENQADAIGDLASSKRLYSSLTQNQVSYKLWDALKKTSDVEDNRFKFY